MAEHSFRTERNFTRRNKNAKAVLLEEQKFCASAGPSDPTYFSINAGPSLKPAKHYCDITGLEAPYKAASGLRYHNVDVYTSKVDRFGQAAHQPFLKLRNANLVLR